MTRTWVPVVLFQRGERVNEGRRRTGDVAAAVHRGCRSVVHVTTVVPAARVVRYLVRGAELGLRYTIAHR